jgi:hypothetical protein
MRRGVLCVTWIKKAMCPVLRDGITDVLERALLSIVGIVSESVYPWHLEVINQSIAALHMSGDEAHLFVERPLEAVAMCVEPHEHPVFLKYMYMIFLKTPEESLC